MLDETIDLLGLRAVDRITRFEGIVIAIAFDIVGNIQALIQRITKKRQLSSKWFDVNRVVCDDEPKVMKPPPKAFAERTASLDFLGYPARDRLTGYTGVVEAVSFHLPGCTVITMTSYSGDKKEIDRGQSFDIARVEKTSETRVMEPLVHVKGTPHGPVEMPPRGYDR